MANDRDLIIDYLKGRLDKGRTAVTLQEFWIKVPQVEDGPLRNIILELEAENALIRRPPISVTRSDAPLPAFIPKSVRLKLEVPTTRTSTKPSNEWDFGPGLVKAIAGKKTTKPVRKRGRKPKKQTEKMQAEFARLKQLCPTRPNTEIADEVKRNLRLKPKIESIVKTCTTRNNTSSI